MKRPSSETRQRLLAAAEQILIDEGITGISVRKVGDLAGVNATLVTYHFKSIANLLEELCRLNLQPILDGWQVIDDPEDGPQDLDGILRAWLEPMLNPAACGNAGRALVVLDEIAAHGDDDAKQTVLVAMTGFSQRLRQALLPLLPSLETEELRVRLRLISGAVLGPPPRSRRIPLGSDGRALDDIEYLVRFAKAALTG